MGSRHTCAAVATALLRVVACGPGAIEGPRTSDVGDGVADHVALIKPVLEAQCRKGLLSGEDVHGGRWWVGPDVMLYRNAAVHAGIHLGKPLSDMPVAEVRRLQRGRRGRPLVGEGHDGSAGSEDISGPVGGGAMPAQNFEQDKDKFEEGYKDHAKHDEGKGKLKGAAGSRPTPGTEPFARIGSRRATVRRAMPSSTATACLALTATARSGAAVGGALAADALAIVLRKICRWP